MRGSLVGLRGSARYAKQDKSIAAAAVAIALETPSASLAFDSKSMNL
jgi:hypothetical protein